MKLHVRTWGDASLPRTAVLVHGIVGTSGTWRHLADALVPRGYRCIAPDLRGHGASPLTDGAYSIPAMAADLGESVATDPDLLIGFSLGGGIAIMATQDGILRPKRLVAIDPALHKSDRAWGQALIDSSEQSPRTVEAVVAANPRWDRSDAEERAIAFQTANWDQMRQIMLDAPEWDVRGRIPELAGRVPTLFVLADPSQLVPPEDARRIEEALGAGSVVVRPNTSHSVHRDDFDGFLTTMLDWLAQDQG